LERTSRQLWIAAEGMIEKKQYMMALFCWHLALEKMFKAA
jgi:hypothetical protein